MDDSFLIKEQQACSHLVGAGKILSWIKISNNILVKLNESEIQKTNKYLRRLIPDFEMHCVRKNGLNRALQCK